MVSGQPVPRINAIACALPASECDATYNAWALRQLEGRREVTLLERMLQRSGIGRRFTVLSSAETYQAEGSFYDTADAPGTLARMEIYSREAPKLALEAIAELGDLGRVTHLVVASCTGFMAPGLDQVIARRLGLDPTVERVVVGFMGCYAGVTALRTAGHIVRSEPSARVLVISVELCTLHLQPTDKLERLLAMAQFADGAAAAIVSAEGEGLALGQGLSLTLEDSHELITWTIGDTGFDMQLSGEVPGRLAEALSDGAVANSVTEGKPVTEIDAWAVHPGGRSIVDAVERGLQLPPEKLTASREVLQDCGNMSSATVMFVLKKLMAEKPRTGIAIAFGPGLAMEGLRFGWTESDAR
ncbi:type III polyketide synthase [Altererythrobacter sp. Root672]|uniref:type III polyketide synthase n=1 Tax=Altererythrobacter sp. Root672 TaxID=1736584 RepID=UPI000700D8CF|nr:type III polyketide synthase [Altererythrobacter sp. Root672]KRA83060.1 stilbene synthase [Altererythrobacter sp. Root672]